MAARTRGRAALNSSARSAPAPASSSLADLVRLILAKTAKPGFSRSDNNHHSEQIILDLPVDGERYLLVRMPKQSHVPLSPRELEIVRMIAQGYSNKIIADILSISSWTVCTHVRRIFAKLGVGSRAAMVARLLECEALTKRAQNSTDSRFELNAQAREIAAASDSRTAEDGGVARQGNQRASTARG